MENLLKALRILVLENGLGSISDFVEVLKSDGFYLDICENSNDFLESIYNNHYDLYIIEINEKTPQRFKLIKLLNDYQDITMKMVIASKPNLMKLSLFYGCDESILKNIDSDETLFRIKALIRRQFKIHSDSICLCRNIEYDIFKKRVLKNKSEISLGEKPLRIIDYLLKFRGFFVSSENLENGVYPANSKNKNGSIRFHIHKIRQLIGEDIIISNRTNGYKINIH
jgi:DNA-binding response OmpR family regulator